MVGTLISAMIVAGAGSPSNLVVTKVGGTTHIKLESGLTLRKTRESVSQPKAFRFPGSTTTVATWQEGKNRNTQIAISLDGTQVERQTVADHRLHTRFADFDPAVTMPQIDERLMANSGNEIYFVQFVSQPLEEMREGVEAIGGKILTYFPGQSYLVQLTAEEKAEVANLSYVRAVTPYHPVYRTEQPVLDALANGTLPAQRYNIQLHNQEPATAQRLKELIEMAGGRVTMTSPASAHMIAFMDATQFEIALNSNDLLFIDRWSAPEPDMDIMKVVMGQNAVNAASPFGTFLGQNIKGAVMDNGLRQTHVGFVNATPLEVQTAADIQSHGTNTFGINFGDGDSNAAGTGMLPLAGKVFADYDAGYLSGAGDRNGLTADLVNRGAFYQSNSWGDALTTAYNTISAQMDTILMNNDIVILNSQSNAGSTNSRPQAWAKNIVSIGGANHFNNTNPDDDRWSSGASIGPAADGRIKPDLANAYDNITTATSTSDTAYTTGFNGTSSATPITAGTFGVMFQMWGRGIFGNACPAPTYHANRPKAALAKAIMINNAEQWSLVAPSDITRNVQGWGRPNILNVFNRRDNFLFVNEDVSLNNLQSQTYRVWVEPGQPNFKVTLVYKDPSGAASATQHRKNNLDLRVTTPSGTQYWGNNGMATSHWTATGGVADVKNTVENVYIQTPASGVYTIQVTGADINTDADTTVAGVNSRFALVANNCVYSVKAADASPSVGSLVGGNLASLEYSDNAVMALGETTGEDSLGNLRFLFVGATVPANTCSSLGVLTELSTLIPSGQMDVMIYNWVTNQYETAGTAAGASINNPGASFFTKTGSQYVNQTTRRVQALLYIKNSNVAEDINFDANLDLVRFHYQP